MSEKLVPATKSVPRGDGIKKGSSNSTLTTPDMNEGDVFNKDAGSKSSILKK